MSVDLEASIIRVLFPDERTAGVGFLVAPGLAVTCAHVVNAAGSGPGLNISIATYNGETHFIADVLNPGWSPESLNDIAFLRVTGTPGDLQPLSLSTAKGRDTHLFSALGFPPDDEYAADRVTGRIGGIIPSMVKGRANLLKLDGKEIRLGMSGSPVLDTQSDQIVGMVCEVKDRGGVRRAYAITAETI